MANCSTTCSLSYLLSTVPLRWLSACAPDSKAVLMCRFVALARGPQRADRPSQRTSSFRASVSDFQNGLYYECLDRTPARLILSTLQGRCTSSQYRLHCQAAFVRRATAVDTRWNGSVMI